MLNIIGLKLLFTPMIITWELGQVLFRYYINIKYINIKPFA